MQVNFQRTNSLSYTNLFLMYNMIFKSYIIVNFVIFISLYDSKILNYWKWKIIKIQRYKHLNWKIKHNYQTIIIKYAKKLCIRIIYEMFMH
jgi:hypothetical protein